MNAFFMIVINLLDDLRSHRLRVAFGLNAMNCYLPQFLQVQLLPQLQFSQVQFGLSHFCLSF
jgi:hypothetical protein